MWLADTQRHLPAPALTILLDIAPETAARRKVADRDRYERDLALLSRVRDSYRRQAAQGGWLRLDGERDKDAVAADVIKAVASRLAPAISARTSRAPAASSGRGAGLQRRARRAHIVNQHHHQALDALTGCRPTNAPRTLR